MSSVNNTDQKVDICDKLDCYDPTNKKQNGGVKKGFRPGMTYCRSKSFIGLTAE